MPKCRDFAVASHSFLTMLILLFCLNLELELLMMRSKVNIYVLVVYFMLLFTNKVYCKFAIFYNVLTILNKCIIVPIIKRFVSIVY